MFGVSYKTQLGISSVKACTSLIVIFVTGRCHEVSTISGCHVTCDKLPGIDDLNICLKNFKL